MKKIRFTALRTTCCAVRPGVMATIEFWHLNKETLFGVVSIGWEQDAQQLLFRTTAFDVDGVVPPNLSGDDIADFIERGRKNSGLYLDCRLLDSGLMQFEVRISEDLTLQGRSGENVEQFFFTYTQHVEAQVSDR